MKVLSISKMLLINWIGSYCRTQQKYFWCLRNILHLIIFRRRLFRTFQSCLKQRRFRYWAIYLVVWSGEINPAESASLVHFLSTLKLHNMCMHKSRGYLVAKYIFTITAQFLRFHWLIFIVNKQTDTWIYNLCDASMNDSGQFVIKKNWCQFLMRQ